MPDGPATFEDTIRGALRAVFKDWGHDELDDDVEEATEAVLAACKREGFLR